MDFKFDVNETLRVYAPAVPGSYSIELFSMRNRCSSSYNADDVHIFASVPLSPAPLPDPVARVAPSRGAWAGPARSEKLAKPTAKPTAKYDHTRQSRPAFHAHDTPARTIHPVKIADSGGSAVTGDGSTVIRAYAASRGRSLGRWGVDGKQQQRTSTWESRVDRRGGRVGKCRLSSVASAWSSVDD